ncbi:oligogalacturonate lyase family protein [Cohnella fermenti]|uniref:oligogalacturonate lyase family protein n=1 Tax=Cohnella fermenti TaxID=2565925 RepID=UPI001454E10C|nr:oligogalacturonate lyase family protein [Cohnella fermenti]
MAIGDRRKLHVHEFADRVTGRTIRRLTDPQELSHHPYFYNRIFTADGSGLVVAIRREGRRNLYLLNLEEQEELQLTDSDNILDFSANLSPDGRALFFCRGNSIVRLVLATLRESVVYETPEGWVGYDNPGLSADGEWIATVEMRAEDRLVSDGGWVVFEAQWAARPLCRIVSVHLPTGRVRIVHEERCWLGHPQPRPGDPATILYCHEGPSHRVDARLWLANAADGAIRCMRPQQPGEMISHEFWLADGSAVACVYRQQAALGSGGSEEVVDPATYRPRTESSELRELLLKIDAVTLAETPMMESSPYCHFIANEAFTLAVGDGQTSEAPYLYAANLLERTEEIVCAHDTSWNAYGTNQDSHPHPAFHPDERRIVFTSDRDGLPAVYMTTRP